jgi:hypothetical protein
MSLRATVEPVMWDCVAPDAASVDVRVVNEGREPELFHDYQARHGSLVLQVEDESGRRVLLPPPPPPDARDLGPARQLAPGESVTLRYAGFPDTRRETGRYRVRFLAPSRVRASAERRSRANGLSSTWCSRTRHRDHRKDCSVVWYEPVSLVRDGTSYRSFRIVCGVVFDEEVNVPITETITDGIPATWSKTYSWNARFRVRVDQPAKRITVTIRLRLAGVSDATAMEWAATVADKWADRCKICVAPRCGSDGFPI